MAKWTDQVKKEIALIKTDFEICKQVTGENNKLAKETLIKSNDAITRLNNSIDQIPNIANTKSDELLNKINQEFNTIKVAKENEVDTFLTAKKESITGAITELKEEYKETKKEQVDNGIELLKKFRSIINEKEEKINKLLKKSGLAFDSITQESLSRKNFELADEKGEQLKIAETLLIVTLAIITLLLIFLFQSSIFEGKEVTISDTLFRATFVLPLGLYAILQARKIHREVCLRDQYHHKGISLASYSGFVTRIENDDSITPDKKTQLLEATFDQVLDNAADKADRYDLEKLKIEQHGITNLFKEIKKIKEPEDISKLLVLLATGNEKATDTVNKD